ncbi:uncharacterized protein EAE97_010371 [Botrytis byssoidea]|uniref:2EXR domain-containing protein n=1 Tax=Botrytis byssoidea TaxID=139641 RepID=A0A9P5LVD6_9HELO|nr:uncharacterized protein EAE97_010371 [Botrytis byssoidea]KAF7926071.1 hypothetical protein EAE97_010371 [Botrytis byssoidea]
MNSTPQQETKALTEFRLFSRLPFELQARIFKEAHPGLVVIDLLLYIFVEADHSTFIVTPPRYYKLNSLLLASRESRAEIFRRFSKFEVITPPLFDDHVHKRSSYFRPHIDILAVKASMILRLYDMGGRLSAENITQLALGLRLWYHPCMSFRARMNNAAKLYTFLSNHFPAFGKLWLIVKAEDPREESPSIKHLRRILDVSVRFMDLDLRVKYAPGLSDRQKDVQEEIFQRKLRDIKKHTQIIAGDFSQFLNTKKSDLWPSPGEATLRYWKIRRPVPALMCLITRDEIVRDVYSCKVEHSDTSAWLWVPTLGVNIACHKDGSPVHKYKGLAQIFDGEPW